MNLQNVYKKIAEDIQYLFLSMVNTLNYDKTFRAKVISKESCDKYKILYKNKEYTAKCDGNLNINDMVWVCAPKNDWNALYVQIGKTLQNQVNQLNSNLTNGVPNSNTTITESNYTLDYCIHNGVCYVSLNNFIPSATGSNIPFRTNFAKAATSVHVPLLTVDGTQIVGHLYINKNDTNAYLNINTSAIASWASFSYSINTN